ncbi:hypothetical protein KUCAC02_004377 [Chaenocephalus aceratus]|uniref:Uncharacterized protein n=1 Tax=Chaenocephalus aceratus TaxID=36190 RepID=A0ACB9WZX2_CHAAC|nr:hypothetical protein KUCAC02_004377 [Chaenocephalus aceratus]
MALLEEPLLCPSCIRLSIVFFV